jgi:hypothetical protein
MITRSTPLIEKSLSPASIGTAFGQDRPWLVVMAATIAVEALWWAAAWSGGLAPLPFLITHLLLAFGALAMALALRAATRPNRGRATSRTAVAAATLVGIGASLFLPLKVAIPKQIPFWLDQPLAAAERQLFGVDPWLLLDRLLGWAAVPADRLYGLWLPVQLLVLFVVVLEPPSRAKSRALIAYSLAWLLLGVGVATLFSSAGPLFYDRLLGGGQFVMLRETLEARNAWVALAESDRMWAAIGHGGPSLIAGISAFPSMHVAISVWMYLAARPLAPRAAPFALAYAMFIWLASVQLGWHYAADGLGGAAGMVAVWALADQVQRYLSPVQSA